MESKDTSNKAKEQRQSKFINSNNKLRNVKSHYIIQKFFEYIPERKSLETIRYNKSIQKWINININHYKAYSETKTSIELDIIPMKGEYGEFININEEDKKYFHIYFNDNKKKEIENTSLYKGKFTNFIFYHFFFFWFKNSLFFLFYYFSLFWFKSSFTFLFIVFSYFKLILDIE